MNFDSNFTALIIALAVMSLLVGLSIYYKTSHTRNAQSSSPNESEKRDDKFVLPSVQRDREGSIYRIQYMMDKSPFKKAPEFVGVTGYINTDPIKLSELKGKVVLVHFWTYTCINCIHTIPHLNDWYQKYSDKGFVIASIHTPEFGSEKNIDNVKEAVKGFEIKYPVIQDNNYGTWNAYGNRYWPRDYLVDSQGFIRYDHVGEGGYNVTENMIQSLLAEPGTDRDVNATIPGLT